jgi:2-polyprenyl-3-methyl-5-hydroxy-6-metoxy-1,4-benzoquinol methylase
MLEKIETCPVCGNKGHKPFLICKDHTVSKEEFQIVECNHCQFKFTTPVPRETIIGKYYQSNEYISHSDTKDGLVNRLYHLVRKITLKNKLSLVNSLTRGRTILDIGCGTGYFLKTCKENGWQIDGMEPDQNARKMAEKLNKHELYSDLFSIQQNHQYDIVTLWHVLEHMYKLNESIIKIKLLMKEQGKLVIAVPNCESEDARIYKENWAAYDVPRHLYHFSQKTMATLLEKHDLKIDQTIPMKFDSFYVSMMSEKYTSENNKPGLIRSFINGCKSNIYGFMNENNYSSIIYIASKK